MENHPNIKCPELMEARDNLQKYFKDNKLNPLKSYSKHPTHGKVIKALVERLNLERSKVMDDYIEKDKKNRRKLFKLTYNKYRSMAKKEKKTKKVEAPAVETEKAAGKPKKEKRVTASKYDYPLVDGREMTADEKKKYRAKLRKQASGDAPKKPKAKKEAKEAKVEKKAKKTTAPEKEAKKVKKAKSKKVED